MQMCKYSKHRWYREAICVKANVKQLVQHNHTFTASLQQYDPHQQLQLNWKEAFGPILCNCPLSLCKEAAGLLRSISERLNPPRLAFPRAEEEREAAVSMAPVRGGSFSEALRKLAQIVLMWRDRVCRAFIPDTRRRMFLPTHSRCFFPPLIVSVRMSSRRRWACGRAGLSWCGGQTLIAAQLCTQPRMWALWQLSGFDVYRVTLAFPPLIPARNYGHMSPGRPRSLRHTVNVIKR